VQTQDECAMFIHVCGVGRISTVRTFSSYERVSLSKY
jgi:hypothetical protein